jgi:hypothetical protein
MKGWLWIFISTMAGRSIILKRSFGRDKISNEMWIKKIAIPF